MEFALQSGHEQMCKRPALLLSPESFNRRIGFAFVCPISNTQRKSPFYIDIAKRGCILFEKAKPTHFAMALCIIEKEV
ncbi:type II toxin-antitoxin system PemK/MazF family toxin [Synechococcus sp. PCC 7335]|uniref:type II toxin-antitoxin system PemK/MazF family toxin n=1 Tax=Synechococcus sp. (strain ATCC 29403 / PCC 7335) TaxID=91464 RepID=UPI001D0D7164